jgi:2-C-methyl-D-erythritol 4-phosphate cytidylyltransferase/2-C-methyl-D-erythritol 2,4-cyclodiphosphate synthase
MYVSAIIAAGGRGLRLGSSLPKQFMTVSGRSVLERCVRLFLTHPGVDEVVVALPADVFADPPLYLRAAAKPLRLVPGGARRQDSVLNAFRALDERSELVVIHDAARPFASAELVSRTIAAAAETGAAIAALPSQDTVKRSAAHDRAGDPLGTVLVTETIPRDEVYLAQTPQVFRRDVLRQALALAESGAEATDEATLAERNGTLVRLVAGEPTNIKITTPDDLPLAEAIARRDRRPADREPPSIALRVGTGYDLHRLVAGRSLVLAGVRVPFDRGLQGHSDADIVCHAVIDAVLGAAAAGDIGRHFPDTDPEWRDADSLALLRRAGEMVRSRGYVVANVDVVVIAERPKLADHADAMRANLADALGIPVANVSIKGKTNEGLGAIGRGEAMAAHAVALVHAR